MAQVYLTFVSLNYHFRFTFQFDLDFFFGIDHDLFATFVLVEDAEFWKAFPLSDFLPRSNSWRTLSRNEFASFIDYKIIEKWTENFSQANLLTMGKCGFKPVYKALLENGSEAVVKKLSCSTPVSQREFEVVYYFWGIFFLIYI